MLLLLSGILLLVQLSQQQDPVKAFCRRWGHQTAVIDEKLWIDGGQVNWSPLAANPQNISNTWLLYNDLTTSPLGANMPQLSATNFKNATIPDVTGGILWADDVNKRFYLYGGEYLNDGVTPNAVNLLSFDAISNDWVTFGAPSVQSRISSVSYAGNAAVSELGQGFALGGWMSNATMPGWTEEPVASSAMIKYDMNFNSWTNSSGPDTTPRAEGVMVYIPASVNGLLIYFGGITAPYYNSTMVPSPMDTIYIYDITSSNWYTQTATGQIPPNRRRFCAGAAWAQDQSSYNIYIYGGLGFGENSTGFDDVWILSLPSFQWIQWYSGNSSAAYHHSLSCNVINNGQMLIIGGSFPNSQNCDSPNTWGTHNLDLGQVSGSKWQVYQPNLTTYHVPPDIISLIGGSALGGATVTKPAAGFQSNDLSVYFTEKATIASRTPTRPIPKSTASNTISSSSKLSPGAIAGIAIGGAAVLIALLVGSCCLIRRYRRRRQPQPQAPPPPNYSFPNYSEVPQSPNSPYTTSGYNTHPRVPAQPHYQLSAEPARVELADNNYHPDPAKNISIQQLPSADEHDYIQDWQTSSIGVSPSHMSPSHSVHSPHPSMLSSRPTFPQRNESTSNTMYSSAGSATSPSPTYSSVGRKPVLQNQTYYSP